MLDATPNKTTSQREQIGHALSEGTKHAKSKPHFVSSVASEPFYMATDTDSYPVFVARLSFSQ
jgi:hypothetical protein